MSLWRPHPDSDELLAESKRARDELVQTAEELERYVVRLNKVIAVKAASIDSEGDSRA